jgi:hypothetical protein
MQPEPAPQTTLPTPAPRRSHALIAATAVSLVLLLLCVAYVFSLRSQLAELDSSSRKAIDAQLQTIVMQTQQVEALDQIAVKVDELNRELGASAGKLQIDNLEAGVADIKARPHLPDEAKKTLAELEQSMAAIREMEAKMKELERYLGAPAVVKRGDTHAEIARRYLIEEAKLDPSEADRVLRRTALAWELEPGNLVFNLYHEGTLLTTVAQGTAKRSPLIAQWARREAVNSRIRDLEQKLSACQAGPAAPQEAPAAEPAAAPAQPAAEGTAD